MTSINFEDATGKPRPDEEIEQALAWVKRKIIRFDVTDPEGVILCVTIKDALEELLYLRRLIEKAKGQSSGGPKA